MSHPLANVKSMTEALAIATSPQRAESIAPILPFPTSCSVGSSRVEDDISEGEVALALRLRNSAWSINPLIPRWVDIEEVGLDRYFTDPDIANECYSSLQSVMESNASNPSDFTFVEPGVGNGAFYDLLPESNRLGIDIMPMREEFIQQDFLTWSPADEGRKYAVIGNPPFGYRAWLALAFLNHSASFAEYIGFILPMSFQSDGKGSPKLRVKGSELVLSEPLPSNAFAHPDGKPVKLNSLWQIWKRGENRANHRKTCDKVIELFTVDTRKERLCGQRRLGDADWFLQRTFYGEPPTLVKDFENVRYACGYGIVIKEHYDAITQLLQDTDWREYSNLAMHNCRHISMYHIRQAVIDGGYAEAPLPPSN